MQRSSIPRTCLLWRRRKTKPKLVGSVRDFPKPAKAKPTVYKLAAQGIEVHLDRELAFNTIEAIEGVNASRTPNKAERNYSTRKRIFGFCKNFRCYMQVHGYMDHKPLKGIFNAQGLTTRFVRSQTIWIRLLERIQIRQIEHQCGCPY